MTLKPCSKLLLSMCWLAVVKQRREVGKRSNMSESDKKAYRSFTQILTEHAALNKYKYETVTYQILLKHSAHKFGLLFSKKTRQL